MGMPLLFIAKNEKTRPFMKRECNLKGITIPIYIMESHLPAPFELGH